MTNPDLVTFCGFSFNVYGAILIALIFVFFFLMWKEHRKNRLDWTDMITRDGRKISSTKIMQLVGGVVGTWIVVKTTLNEKLTWDLFAIYLAYVASADGFSKFITARYSGGGYGGGGYQRSRNEDSEDDQDEQRPSCGAKTPDPSDL
jgi:hypothetical protein